ncbi:cation diffusion facilitator family transporter [Lachnospiraceae bacterium C7]|nr:cation diffusion facilitator family transporter [Lachnospiraceae bacterium C7]
MDRDKQIIKTSIIGIIANVFLAGFKAVVGLITGSIAVILDAINNLSDALSSVVTIIGTKLAKKRPDKKHPLGYGRIEYISATIIACIVVYAGITSLTESVKEIIHPTKPNYSVASIVIIAVAVVVKIALGTYVKKTGEKVKSDSLIASGSDSLFDAIISTSTVIAALIFTFTNVSLEAYLGAIISVVIIKSGIEILTETLSKILGERVDGSFTKEIKKTISSVEGVDGAYDLVLHNYGPDRYTGSVHIEVKDSLTAADIDTITRKIQKKVFQEHKVIIEGVGIYSVNTKNDKAGKLRIEITKKVLALKDTIQVHGFYVDFQKKTVIFDVVIAYSAPDIKKVVEEVSTTLKKDYPDFTFTVNADRDITD